MDVGIPIDITNPDDIRSKLPELEDLIRHRRRELDKLDAAVDKLAALAGAKRQRPKARNGRAAKAAPKRRTSRVQVREIVESMGGPATVAQVAEKTNPPIKQKTVGWALWKEAEAGGIKVIAKGVYAPLSYSPQELVPPETRGR